MHQYKKLIRDVLEKGEDRPDRTGVGTRSVFGRQLKFDLKYGFPLVTVRKIHFKSIVIELLWFLKGDTNIKYLNDNGVSIWNEWADESGELGSVYGKLWRNFHGVDQISNIVNELKNNPHSRRHLVVAFDPSDQPQKAPQGCHSLFQFYVSNKGLSLHLYQRSADLMLGVPFNIASYALLTHMVASVCGLQVNEFIHSFGDVHIYKNHIEGAHTLLSRKCFPSPQIEINKNIDSIFDFSYQDIKLLNYQSHDKMKFEIAV